MAAKRHLTVVKPKATIKQDSTTILPLDKYDAIIVSFSGGKDSLACVLHLLDIGAPRDRIELWHQAVDGEPGKPKNRFMDWPVTEEYCRAVADHLGLPLYFQWKVDGYEGELLRDKALTKPGRFQMPDGTVGEAGGEEGKLTTRRMFPQQSGDLSVRWCSSYVKIDVAKKALSNDPRFKKKGTKILMITGERREESSGRALYAEAVEHSSTSRSRRVDQWRMIIDWPEKKVWEIIKRHLIRPHPAYYAGFSRVSCLPCIFGNEDQWATILEIAPAMFRKIAKYEKEFGANIDRGEKLPITERAQIGESYTVKGGEDAEAHAYVGMQDKFLLNIAIPKGTWELPRGAYGHSGGPT
jgi:3'-phosphoadenosine 5'-phosphosulfate sulfotransferase (PAPS reductase)/FAD synthetase